MEAATVEAAETEAAVTETAAAGGGSSLRSSARSSDFRARSARAARGAFDGAATVGMQAGRISRDSTRRARSRRADPLCGSTAQVVSSG